MLPGSSDIEVNGLPSARLPANDAPKAALVHARACLETKLAENENWRALTQLDDREAAGELLGVVQGDLLRTRLTLAISAAPEFMAWQFLDAAIACLEAGEQAAGPPAATTVQAPHRSEHSMAAYAAPDAIEIPSTPLIPIPPDATVSQDLQPLSISKPASELAQRIPTLHSHERRNAVVSESVQTAIATAEQALQEAVAVTANHPAPEQPIDPDDSDINRFSAAASGIEEADVQIVVREPRSPMLTVRLPPLPLTQPSPGKRLPRGSRAPALKWAEPEDDAGDDYRPIGSALDEAHVAIIATSDQSRSRADRRALGVAPDREHQMRRFLRALAGE